MMNDKDMATRSSDGGQQNIAPSPFDDIRPYYDSEINAAMRRITDNRMFPVLAAYVYPGRDVEELRQKMRNFQSCRDFQHTVMMKVNQQVIERTISEFTYHGLGYLRDDKKYLFISNHRDIMLDASMLQYILVSNGFETTEITFGANLMSSPLIIDIGKSNKMFRVDRGGNMKDFYMSSKHLSDYIRHDIINKQESVWIAQRNGRTKDGNDRTDQGIIKMFCLSQPQDKISALADLNIIPVSISYEWESCDILKALELYESRFEKYVKKPGEDLNSILTGISRYKGRVNISFCPQITRHDLLAFDDCTNNEYHKQVAQLIDRRILSAYQLTPNNYIAHDIRYGNQDFSNHYTNEQRDAFVRRMQKLHNFDIDEPDVLQDIFLGIYANPVKNKKDL
jgi:1-acyl-sn-glycerol-3-phosphate acyltransferase